MVVLVDLEVGAGDLTQYDATVADDGDLSVQDGSLVVVEMDTGASLLKTLICNSRRYIDGEPEKGRCRAGFHYIGPDGSCEVEPVLGESGTWIVRIWS